MMKYAGLYEIIAHLEKQLTELGCKVVTFGDQTDYDQDKITNAPGAHITPVGLGVISNKEQNYELEIFIYQLKEHHKFGRNVAFENTLDALDETALIANRLAARLQKRNTELIDPGEATYVTVQGGVNFAAALVEGNSNLTGWLGTISVTISGNVGNC